MGAANSKEKEKISETFKRWIREAQEKEEVERGNRMKNLSAGEDNIDDPEIQIKTACFQPAPNKISKKENIKTWNFKSSPIRKMIPIFPKFTGKEGSLNALLTK